MLHSIFIDFYLTAENHMILKALNTIQEQIKLTTGLQKNEIFVSIIICR